MSEKIVAPVKHLGGWDPLRRPDDWVDWKERNIKTRDVSKVPRYVEPDGMEHWWDVNENVIRTNDEKVFLSFHSYYARDFVGFSYAKLHFDGSFVTITQDHDPAERVVLSPNYRQRTEEGELVWHVDQIFRTFKLPDNESYPWVEHADALPVVEVRGMDGFKSVGQQSRFIHLIKTLLSRHDGLVEDALIGRQAKGKVIFGDKLLRSFETGELTR